ncbi:MAG: response regulator transcription factor [Bacteroidales bacterium]
MEKKILLVDDDDDILEFLKYNLERSKFKVYTASNGIDAIKIATRRIPDLIILDVMMPEMDGIETCQELKKNHALNHTLITFLSARSEDYSQIAGFNAGADDYIKKPIRPRVLISKINALMKRSKKFQTKNKLITIDNITIDNDKFEVKKDQNIIPFPKKEFELLKLLCSKPNKVFTREEIFTIVWGNDIMVCDRTIDVHIRKIREKLGTQKIKTLKGIGYSFHSTISS